MIFCWGSRRNLVDTMKLVTVQRGAQQGSDRSPGRLPTRRQGPEAELLPGEGWTRVTHGMASEGREEGRGGEDRAGCSFDR